MSVDAKRELGWDVLKNIEVTVSAVQSSGVLWKVGFVSLLVVCSLISRDIIYLEIIKSYLWDSFRKSGRTLVIHGNHVFK